MAMLAAGGRRPVERWQQHTDDTGLSQPMSRQAGSAAAAVAVRLELRGRGADTAGVFAEALSSPQQRATTNDGTVSSHGKRAREQGGPSSNEKVRRDFRGSATTNGQSGSKWE